LSRNPVKAVVYPARTVAGYGHIYSLGVAGIPVVALHSKWGYAFHSRYVKERYVTPDAAQQPEAFVDWLIRYGKQQTQKPVLFLAEDLYAFLASANAERLSQYYRYPYIDLDCLPLFFDKRLMFREAEAAGLNVPPTLFSPLSDDQVRSWRHFPAVIKPVVSRFSFSGAEVIKRPAFPKIFKGKALEARNYDALQSAVRAVEREGFEYCVQRLIPGPNDRIYNVKFVADRDGRIPSCFISKKQRQQPADFGTCCVAISEYAEELHQQTQAFCTHTQYCGPGGMEFKRDSDCFWFIEVNPRLDFWIRMAVLKGVNLPLQQYCLSLGQELKSAKQEDGGPAWIDIEGDLKGKWWRTRHPEYPLDWKEYVKPYRAFDEAVWNRRDPIPGLLNFARMVPSLIRSRFSR
jgi:predicted ATP-grasp superfamily ATP-dependent carboligase